MKREKGAPKKRVKKSVIIKRVIVTVLILAVLAGIGVLGYFLYRPVPEQTDKSRVIRGDVEEKYTISNDDLELTLYGATTQFTLKEKKTGRVWSSNPGDPEKGDLTDPNGVAIGSSKLNDMRSTLVVAYSASSADKDLNNWEYSIDKQAYDIRKLEREDGKPAIEVHYSVGQMQGVSKIPMVFTEARWKEITDSKNGRIAKSEDSNTRGLRSGMANAGYSKKTIGELAQDTAVDKRLLGAHVLELSLTNSALDKEEYTWVKEAIDELDRASIKAYSAEDVQAALDENAEALTALLGDENEAFRANALSEDEEVRREAEAVLSEKISAAKAQLEAEAMSAEALAEGDAEDAAEDAAEEAESALLWADSLLELIGRPNVEPVDLEALAATVESHLGDFFSGNQEVVDSVLELIRSEDAADKKAAADEIEQRVSEAELNREENAWAKELIDALNASAAEDYTGDAVKAMVAAAGEDAERKALMDSAFFVADFLPLNAKNAINLALYGSDPDAKRRTEGIGYTEEEYLADSAWELPVEENLTVLFEVTVRYILDGPDFVVEVPYDQIRYNAAAPITYLTVLPMFGAAGPDQYDDGFIFVPEGGGALINYNNGKIQQNYYNANLYGWDYASKRSEAISETKNTFPVFGLTNKGGSFICIIEEGASYASVRADISGVPGSNSTFHPNSYNTVCARYHVLHSDQYNVSAKTANMVIMYEKQVPQENVVQRYRFLDSDSYVDMAKAYGDYLRDEYPTMTETDASEDMPVTVELIGAIDKRVVTAGMPMQRVLATTTFDQMKGIIDDLCEQGVKALNVRVSGWANGGITQRVLTGVNVEGPVGGDGGMRSLIDYAKQKGVKLYFDGVTAFAYDTKFLGGFTARSDAARYTTREIVEITPYSQIYFTEDEDRKVYYLTKPEYAQKNASNLIKALKERSAYGVAFRDIGYILSGNYDPNNITTREAVKKMNVETLKEARDNGERVMIREGYDYAMPYADIITDMDLNGIDYSLLDATVPFYQIAIHGAVDYTGPALNLSGDWRTELLHCAEYGAGLNFTFMKEDAKILQDTEHSAYYGSSYDSWREEAIREITRYQTEMAGLNRTRITGHMVLPMDAAMTEYEDGTRVYVNYGPDTYTLADGTEIPGRDYKVLRGDTSDFQAVVEPSGKIDLVNYTANTYTAGDTAVRPFGTTRVAGNAKADVAFLGEGERVYVNADSEPITVAGGQTVAPGETLRVKDDTEFEVIFTSDGQRMYVNYTDTAMNAGAVTVPAQGYVRVSEPISLDAVVIAPKAAEAAPSEEAAEGETLYRVVWVNATDADITVAGETVAARSYQWSASDEEIIVAFRPEGRLYVNRTAETPKAGANTIPAANTLTVADEQPVDVIFLGGEHYARIYVNNTDSELDFCGSAVPAKGTAPASQGETVEVVFLPDGGRVYINYTAAAIKAGDRTIQPSTSNNNSFYLIDAEPPALDTIVMSATVGETTMNLELWINGTDEALTIDGVEVPARGTAMLPVPEGVALQIVVLPDGTVRVIRHTGLPPQMSVAGTNIAGNTWADYAALADPIEVEGDIRYLNLSDAEVTVAGVTLAPGEVSPDDGAPPEASAEAAPEESTEEGGDAQ